MAQAVHDSGRSAGLGHESYAGARHDKVRGGSVQARLTSPVRTLQVVCRRGLANGGGKTS